MRSALALGWTWEEVRSGQGLAEGEQPIGAVEALLKLGDVYSY